MAMQKVVALMSFVLGATEAGLVLGPGMSGRVPVTCEKGEEFLIDDTDPRYAQMKQFGRVADVVEPQATEGDAAS
jgi:hypothetical protein